MAAAGGSWKGGNFTAPTERARGLMSDAVSRWQGQPVSSIQRERQRVHTSLRQGEMRLESPRRYGLNASEIEAISRSVAQERAVVRTLDRLLRRAS